MWYNKIFYKNERRYIRDICDRRAIISISDRRLLVNLRISCLFLTKGLDHNCIVYIFIYIFTSLRESQIKKSLCNIMFKYIYSIQYMLASISWVDIC